MNQCNFIDTWMAATRKRSSSVTRQQNTSLNSSPSTSTTSSSSSSRHRATNPTDKERRASSSNDLVASPSAFLTDQRSSSGNHLAGGASTETIYSNDHTQRHHEYQNHQHLHHHLHQHQHHHSRRTIRQNIQETINQISLINSRPSRPTQISLSPSEGDEDLLSPSSQHLLSNSPLIHQSDILNMHNLQLLEENKSMEGDNDMDPIETGIDMVDLLQRDMFHRNFYGQPNSTSHHHHEMYAPRFVRPIEISISTGEEEIICPSDQHEPLYVSKSHEICPSDTLDTDSDLYSTQDSLRLADECKSLENEIRDMEDIVDQLERERFHPDVSRTLVDNVIQQRKRLRNIELEIYKLGLESSPAKTV